MDQLNPAQMFLVTSSDKFHARDINLLTEALEHADELQQRKFMVQPYKHPILTLVLSISLGVFGVDRFYLGDIFLGILKLVLVFFLVGIIWSFVDIYLCYQKSKDINLRLAMQTLAISG